MSKSDTKSVFEGLFRAISNTPTTPGAVITVELKDGTVITGNLVSTDTSLNVRLGNVIVDETKFPQLAGIKTMFIRGNWIRYIDLSAAHVDLGLLAGPSSRVTASPPSRYCYPFCQRTLTADASRKEVAMLTQA